MKNKFKYIVIIILLLFLVGCNNPTQKKTYIITIEYNNGQLSDELAIEEGLPIVIDEVIEYSGYDFCGWYLNEELTIPLTENYTPTENITIYAKWEVSKNKVTFYVDDVVFNEQLVEEKGFATDPGTPTKQGYEFVCWSGSKQGDTLFNFSRRITKDTDVYAVFKPKPFTITYDFGYDVYYTKQDLYIAFFTDFYNFMIEYTDVDFSKFKITTVEEFLEFCMNWNANGKDSFYGVGDAFSKYYVTIEIGGELENQPTATFIGYCYQNEKYLEFIPFLMQFFAYWRTDEGYTGSSSDPNNLGNDFFASAWASLVDTCKFFYFTSANLNDTYSWFKSERVKEALDNVPGVIENNYQTTGTIENPIILVELQRDGYKFLGWYDENNNKITEVSQEMTVYAKWEKQ